jgi:hypothetical protein
MNNHSEPKSGPFENLSQACFSGLDAAAKGFEPLVKGMGRWHLEWIGLISRRVHAWVELPARLGDCKSPPDLINEQARFWQSAGEDYADGTRRLVAAAAACTVVPGVADTLLQTWVKSLESNSALFPRDYLKFPGAKDTPSVPTKRVDERRAA